MGRDATAAPAGSAPRDPESRTPPLAIAPLATRRRAWGRRAPSRPAGTHDADRPREKLLARGPGLLTDAELVALIVGSGTRGRDALAIARDVAMHLPSPGGGGPDATLLSGFSGIGVGRACAIVAALELGRRRASSPEADPPAIGGPGDVFVLARDIRERRREHFLVFYLDARHRVSHAEIISIGTLNASLVHPREVFSPAIARPAASVVLCHNHPSGETTPSDDDVAITRRLQQAGDLLGIPVLDHVVVSARGWTSFREARLL